MGWLIRVAVAIWQYTRARTRATIAFMRRQRTPAVQSPDVLDFISHSEKQTIRIGQRLGEQVQPGDLVLLAGDLGVGKTQLVKGIALGLGSTDMVTSPSFVLVNEYRAGEQWPGMHIYHADLYRIGDPAEIRSIGLEELWSSSDVCLVEWADQGGDMLPPEHLAVHMRHLDETKRVLRFTPAGKRYQQLVEAFKATAFG